ncbi:M15 family metallopeptidase [Candidatus Halocynthiibacter alkanivorans]|jgi:D-alanyl-D-alanine carboxypeptidase|uniref:M15 family metallopeptidase n=1 Tax=Candidatus Halocynthiibacter alkanivorans TaxID=2267619 RepID=UPI000DF4610D|nr:M15 family metallopeptidase [Candidatus Halocynthiibacter alkanivorans]
MRYLPAVIIAISLLLTPVVWYLAPIVISVEETFDGPAIDSGARIEIEMMRQQLESLQDKLASLETQLNSAARGPVTYSDQDGVVRDGPNTIIDAYAQVVQIADRRNVNSSLSVASPDFLEATLGRPRATLSDKCEAMTNETLLDMLMLESVGPIRVRMLSPAIESLRRVFDAIDATDPDLFQRINTAGSLCVRQIRGTVGRLSSHSFGLSVDLNIDGALDTLGDGKTQLGLTILADFFKTEGWIWGAGFSREDSMHFEVSREKVEEWRSQGLI